MGPVLFKITRVFAGSFFESYCFCADEWEIIVRFAAFVADVCNEVLRNWLCESGLSF